MTDTKPPAEQLLVELAELHMRTHASPLPKHPGAMGWQANTGVMAAGFARTLHALMQVAPEKAAEITEWFQGPFGEGPDPFEHTDWTGRHVAKSPKVLDQWLAEARAEAVRAKEFTEAWEKTERNRVIEPDATREEEQDDRRILRAAPADSDDWDDATWAAWARVADRAHGKRPKSESDR